MGRCYLNTDVGPLSDREEVRALPVHHFATVEYVADAALVQHCHQEWLCSVKEAMLPVQSSAHPLLQNVSFRHAEGA